MSRGNYSTFRLLHIGDIMKRKTWWTRAEISYEIAKDSPSIIPASVYRTLNKLLQRGIVSECTCRTSWGQQVRLLKWEGLKK